jgi:hypothetical protein
MQEESDDVGRPEEVDPLITSIYDQLITSVCIDVSLKMHRMIKTRKISHRDLLVSSRMELYPGLYENEEGVREALDKYGTADKNDPYASNDNAGTSSVHVMTRQQANPQTDIWGRPPRPPSENVECSVCNRQVSTVRFAPHLDKCMGIGTTSRAGGASASSTRNKF